MCQNPFICQFAILECLDQLGLVEVFLYVNIQKWKNLINVPTTAFGVSSINFLRESNLNQFTWPIMNKDFLIVLFTLVHDMLRVKVSHHVHLVKSFINPSFH